MYYPLYVKLEEIHLFFPIQSWLRTKFLYGTCIIWLVNIKYINGQSFSSISNEMTIWDPKNMLKSTNWHYLKMRIFVSYFTENLSPPRFFEIFHFCFLQWLDKVKCHLALYHFFEFLFLWPSAHKKVSLPSVSAHFCGPKATKIKIQKSGTRQGGVWPCLAIAKNRNGKSQKT